MLLKINRAMRVGVLIFGVFLFLIKLRETKHCGSVENKEGFQTEEFDDIW